MTEKGNEGTEKVKGREGDKRERVEIAIDHFRKVCAMVGKLPSCAN